VPIFPAVRWAGRCSQVASSASRWVDFASSTLDASITLVPQAEVHDAGIVRQVRQYFAREAEGSDPGRQHRIDTRIIQLTPTVVLAEAKVTSDDGENDTALFLVGSDLIDLFAPAQPHSNLCGGLGPAFEVYSRLYVYSFAGACEADVDATSAFIYDMSGPLPRRVRSSR